MWDFFKNCVFGNHESVIDNSIFCYIVGSFARTASKFRTPKSDNDILSSPNFDKYEIDCLLRRKYPDIPHNTKIDINYVLLINNPNITFDELHDEKDFTSVVRNSDATELLKYLNNTIVVCCRRYALFFKTYVLKKK